MLKKQCIYLFLNSFVKIYQIKIRRLWGSVSIHFNSLQFRFIFLKFISIHFNTLLFKFMYWNELKYIKMNLNLFKKWIEIYSKNELKFIQKMNWNLFKKWIEIFSKKWIEIYFKKWIEIEVNWNELIRNFTAPT